MKIAFIHGDMIPYLEIPKALLTINEFSKASRFKINIQTLFVFLCTSHEYSKNEIKKTVHSQYIKKSKILRNKFNIVCIRPVYWKL